MSIIGWICPKCGAPNAPTNDTCVACFSSNQTPVPTIQVDETRVIQPKPEFLIEADGRN